MTDPPSRPVVPAEKDEAMSLEQRVAEAISDCSLDDIAVQDRDEWLALARDAISVVRESIARDLEAERDKLDPLGDNRQQWKGLNAAADIARNGAST